jgi:hypothetical protein
MLPFMPLESVTRTRIYGTVSTQPAARQTSPAAADLDGSEWESIIIMATIMKKNHVGVNSLSDDKRERERERREERERERKKRER